MAVKNISTVFTTNKHQTIASGYEVSLYDGVEQVAQDFAIDINNQFESFEGAIETFTVIAKYDDGKTTTQTYVEEDEGINPFEIIDFVKECLGVKSQE